MHLITIDLEDWFHILDNSFTKSYAQWEMYENRIHRNTYRIISELNKQETKASFFCLGWVAEKYPEVIREIVNHGHEIGSHTHYHQLLYEQKPDIFREDLTRSIKTLEGIVGRKIRYFRAPGFSVTEKNKWVFDILVEQGIEIDCSIFPASRAHGGFPTYAHHGPSIIKYNGISIKELPISYKKFFGMSVIFSGGGYFRLLPYQIIKALTKRSEYVMSYFHPRDFDPYQPMIPGLSPIRKFKSYYGLRSAMPKFERWLNDFHCVDISTADKMIDWSSVPVVEL
jgi:peptidoglycan-N-acetylglucosamine deacetylase